MADESDDIEKVRRERDEAIERAQEAERALEGQRRALALGVPSELAHHFVGTTMSDEEIRQWNEGLRDHIAERTEQALQEARPDRRGNGRFLVQNLDAIEASWLRERLQARTRR
jgi:hypothetical protein